MHVQMQLVKRMHLLLHSAFYYDALAKLHTFAPTVHHHFILRISPSAGESSETLEVHKNENVIDT